MERTTLQAMTKNRVTSLLRSVVPFLSAIKYQICFPLLPEDSHLEVSFRDSNPDRVLYSSPARNATQESRSSRISENR